MATEADDQVVPLNLAASGLPEEGSLLDQLRQARQEAAKSTQVDIRLPGYDNSPIKLFARYRLLNGKEIDEQARKSQKEFKLAYERNLYGSIDLLAKACVGFFYDDGEGEKKPLTLGGHHITGYNEQLADAFKISIDPNHPVRSIVLGMFDNNDVALGAHNVRLTMWMSDTSIDVDQGLLGNL